LVIRQRRDAVLRACGVVVLINRPIMTVCSRRPPLCRHPARCEPRKKRTHDERSARRKLPTEARKTLAPQP
jgi:hypothetical protein